MKLKSFWELSRFTSPSDLKVEGADNREDGSHPEVVIRCWPITST